MRCPFLISILLICLIGNAQRIEEKALIKYTQDDGLSSYNVRKIIQDKHGFIWAATQDGLNRFDGRNFIVYKKNAPAGRNLLGVDIRDVIEDTINNLIWVLPGEGGLNAIELVSGKVVKSIIPQQSGAADWNIRMSLINDKLWIGSFSGLKQFDIKKDQFISFPVDPLPANANPADYEIREIFTDHFSNTWVCYGGYGIVIFNNKDLAIRKKILLQDLDYKGDYGIIRFSGHSLIGSNTVLLGTTIGLKQIMYDSNYNISINNSPCVAIKDLNNLPISALSNTGTNELLISSQNGLYKFNSALNEYTFIEEPKGSSENPWLNSVRYICRDKSNDLWIGCQQGLGFINSSTSPFRRFYYDPSTDIKLPHVFSLGVLKDKSILAGLRSGLVRIDANHRFHQINNTNLFHHIYTDRNNRVHALHSKGMLIYDDQKLFPVSKYYPEFQPYAGYPINSHLDYNDSLVILGTENSIGILVWDLKNRSVKNINSTSQPISLAADIVNAVFKDKANNVWVLSDKVITVLSQNLTKSTTLSLLDSVTKQPYNIYFDICEARRSYWITAYGTGLMELDYNFKLIRILTTKDGLSNDGVYKIFNSNDKELIITSNKGISLYNIQSKTFSRFYEQDGLHSNEFEENSGTIDNGVFYAGGVKGFTSIDPGNFSINSSAPVLFLSNLKMESSSGSFDTSILFSRYIRISNNILQTRIDLSALNYRNPQRTTFSYKINEIHNNWINLNTQNFIPLIGLSNGTYHIQVQAFNEDGVPSEIKELTLVYLPKWHQTWWFRALVALLVAATFYGLYRFRINHLKKEEEIRIQVAGDLHDELGSTLNSVKVFTNLALMEKENKSHLEKIKEATQSAISGVKDIIWVLDDKRDTLDHLLGRINQFAGPICEAAGISYKQQPGGNENYKLGKEEKRNLYMIIKESINNSIKYAECSAIELLIKNNGGKLSISISDDGKGFDKSGTTSGYGLRNIKHRAGEIGYQVEFNSSPGSGMLIYLEKK